MIRPQRRIERRGFTLIETLVCIALCALLFSAIYGATHQQMQLRTAGISQVERSMQLLGTAELLRRDLEHIQIERDPIPVLGEDRSNELFELTRIEERLLQFDDGAGNSRLGFWGNPDSFVFSCRSESISARTQPDDVQVVMYCVSNGVAVDVPIQRRKSGLRRINVPLRSSSAGLLRIIAASDEASQDAVDRSTLVEELSPEIVDIRFRYFDGHDWSDRWHPETANEWPRSIEVTLWRQADAALVETMESESVRIVIGLPVQSPGQSASIGGALK